MTAPIRSNVRSAGVVVDEQPRQRAAELILRNGRIASMDPSQRLASAVAVRSKLSAMRHSAA